MSVLIKGGRIVTASDDYVGDVYVENGTVTTDRRVARRRGRQGDRRERQVRDPGRDRPAHPHRDVLRRDDDLRRLHLRHGLRRVRRHDVAGRLLHAGAGDVVPAGARELLREDRALQAGDRRRLPHRRHRPRGGGRLEELAKLPDEGITSYKLFMAYKGAVMVDDETLFKTMQTRERDRRARDGARRERRRDRRDRQGGGRGRARASRSGTRARGRWRPRRRRRTARSSSRASPAPRSTSSTSLPAESVEPIALAREKGWDVWGETCTQYLFIDDSALEKPDLEGAKYIYTPPPRPKAEQEHLWKALRNDVLSVVSTDHCPFNWPEQKGINGRGLPGRPERRPGDREPAAHAARVRRPHRPDHD